MEIGTSLATDMGDRAAADGTSRFGSRRVLLAEARRLYESACARERAREVSLRESTIGSDSRAAAEISWPIASESGAEGEGEEGDALVPPRRTVADDSDDDGDGRALFLVCFDIRRVNMASASQMRVREAPRLH